MYMMLLVLDNPDQLDDVLDAWHAVGVNGVTVLESSSRHRRQQTRPLGARYLFGAVPAVTHHQAGHFTLLSIVPNLDVVHACQRAVESITGNLDLPNTGILAAWEIAHVKGLDRVESDT